MNKRKKANLIILAVFAVIFLAISLLVSSAKERQYEFNIGHVPPRIALKHLNFHLLNKQTGEYAVTGYIFNSRSMPIRDAETNTIRKDEKGKALEIKTIWKDENGKVLAEPITGPGRVLLPGDSAAFKCVWILPDQDHQPVSFDVTVTEL